MRRIGAAAVALVVVVAPAAPAGARPAWQRRIDDVVPGRRMSVAVRLDGKALYEHRAGARRVPASTQKALLAMALYDRLGPDAHLVTAVAARGPQIGLVRSDLWLRGRGDPSVAGTGAFARALPFRPTRLARLARAVAGAGITAVAGRVVGSTGHFSRDWFAPGWKDGFPEDEVPLATALAVDGNERHGVHLNNPEQRAARLFTRALERAGVQVRGRPTTGRAPADLTTIASVESPALEILMRYAARSSSNFFAEMMGKALAVARSGPPGTIAGGARAIAAWAEGHGVAITANDSSGLSYANRVSARGVARLLEAARAEPWGPRLRTTLAAGGQGTLAGRLADVRVRAKTGTLAQISALSGWVWLTRTGEWAEFSILSRGLAKARAVAIEDRIVRILTRAARPAPPPGRWSVPDWAAGLRTLFGLPA